MTLKHPGTVAPHAGWRRDAATKAVAVPIHQTTSYQFDDTAHEHVGLLGTTEDEAWNRARDILKRIRALRGDKLGKANPKQESEGSIRLLEAAKGGRVRDRRMWTEVAAAVGAEANTTALVGTPIQVAEALAEYHALGVTTFLIRGFDPLDDAIAYGRDLLPATRAIVAARRSAEAA